MLKKNLLCEFIKRYLSRKLSHSLGDRGGERSLHIYSAIDKKLDDFAYRLVSNNNSVSMPHCATWEKLYACFSPFVFPMNRLHIDSAVEKNCLHSLMTLTFEELSVSLYTLTQRRVNVLLIGIIKGKVSRLFCLDLSDTERSKLQTYIVISNKSHRIFLHSNDLFFFLRFRLSVST